MAGGKEGVPPAKILSARRPCQPVLTPPCGYAFCHSLVWSECEKRLTGSWPTRLPFCLVTPFTSVPTLATRARRLFPDVALGVVEKSGPIGARLGWSPKLVLARLAR